MASGRIKPYSNLAGVWHLTIPLVSLDNLCTSHPPILDPFERFLSRQLTNCLVFVRMQSTMPTCTTPQQEGVGCYFPVVAMMQHITFSVLAQCGNNKPLKLVQAT